jgi:hypothetical protein
MTQPAPTPANPIFYAWLQSLDPCAPALTAFLGITNYQTGYPTIGRADWLTWINFRQVATMAQVNALTTALLNYMSPDIMSAVSSDAGTTTVFSAAVTTMQAFLTNPSSVSPLQLRTMEASIEKCFPNLPAKTDPTYGQRSFAITTLARLARLCMATTQMEAANVSVELSNAWTQLEVFLSKVPADSAIQAVFTALLPVLPFNGSFAPAGS